MADPTDLHAVALEILELSTEALDTIPIADTDRQGAPPRRFVHFGPPIADCPDQLTVHVTPVLELDTSPGGLDAGKRTNRAWRNSATFVIVITRCVPVGGENAGAWVPPSADALTAASAQHNADVWALWNYLHGAKASEEFLTLCDQTFFDGANAIIPIGDIAGWQMTVRAVLDGYAVPFGT